MPDVKTTSTEQKLGTGPATQPHTGRMKPKLLGSSTQMPLKTGSPISNAHEGAKPGHGQVTCNSTTLPLSRTANSPYQDKKLSANSPQTNFGKGKRGK